MSMQNIVHRYSTLYAESDLVFPAEEPARFSCFMLISRHILPAYVTCMAINVLMKFSHSVLRVTLHILLIYTVYTVWRQTCILRSPVLRDDQRVGCPMLNAV